MIHCIETISATTNTISCLQRIEIHRESQIDCRNDDYFLFNCPEIAVISFFSAIYIWLIMIFFIVLLSRYLISEKSFWPPYNFVINIMIVTEGWITFSWIDYKCKFWTYHSLGKFIAFIKSWSIKITKKIHNLAGNNQAFLIYLT